MVIVGDILSQHRLHNQNWTHQKLSWTETYTRFCCVSTLHLFRIASHRVLLLWPTSRRDFCPRKGIFQPRLQIFLLENTHKTFHWCHRQLLLYDRGNKMMKHLWSYLNPLNYLPIFMSLWWVHSSSDNNHTTDTNRYFMSSALAKPNTYLTTLFNWYNLMFMK